VKLNALHHLVLTMMRAAITPLLRVPPYFAQEQPFLYLSLLFLVNDLYLFKLFLSKCNYFMLVEAWFGIWSSLWDGSLHLRLMYFRIEGI